MVDAKVLKAPWPWAGGKSRVADRVWKGLGNVDNFCEPFCGSAAVLLRRPAEHFRNGYRVETLNDANGFVVNAWRAIRAFPDQVAEHADHAVTEASLHAFHRWLVRGIEDPPEPPPAWTHGAEAWSEAHRLIRGEPWDVDAWRRRLAENPDYCDPKVAGRWIFGCCCWIGGGWCSQNSAVATPETADRPSLHPEGEGGVLANLAAGDNSGICKIPELSSGSGRGDAASPWDSSHKLKMPNMGTGCGDAASGPPESRPQLADAFDIGRGVNGNGGLSQQIPYLSHGGQGVDSLTPVADHQKRPHFSYGGIGVGVNKEECRQDVGTCESRRAWLVAWMRILADRLRIVRTCYGHWSRICDSDSTLTRLGLTGVFLDPPYCLSVERMRKWVANLNGDGPKPGARKGKAERDPNLYATDKDADIDLLVAEVQVWCLKWGGDRDIRICLAGYEGEHNALEAHGWTKFEWAATGGYGNQRRKGKAKNENSGRERLWFSPGCIEPEDSRGLFDEFEDENAEPSE